MNTMMEKPQKFVSTPNSHLLCPICNDILKEPMISRYCGHSFCNTCACEHIEKGSLKCPHDSVITSTSGDLFPNKALEDQVKELRIHCRYGLQWSQMDNDFTIDPNGCPEHLINSQREDHEEECEFAFRSCPNNPDVCGRFRRKDEEQHFSSRCKFVPCKFGKEGCDFRSALQDLQQHEVSCAFDSSNDTVQRPLFDKQIRELQIENHELKNSVNTLTQRLQRNEQTNQRLEEEVLDIRSTMQKVQEDATHRLGKYEQKNQRLEEELLDLRSSVEKFQEHGERTRQLVETLAMSRHRTSSARTSRPASTISLSNSLSIEKWNMPFQFKCIGTLKGHKGSVNSLTRMGSGLFSADSDAKIKRWDLESIIRGCCQTLTGHSDVVYCMCSAGSVLYSASADGTLRAWSSEGVEMKQALHTHENVVCTMVASTTYLFTSSLQCIKMWDAQNLTELKEVKKLSHWVRALLLSPDILYSGAHNVIQMWETNQNLSLKQEIEHSYGSAYSLALSKDYLILGTYNRVVQLFNSTTHEHIKSLAGHIGAITGLNVSPSGRFLFSSSADTTVQIWSLESLLPIQTLRRHEGEVTSMLLYGDLLLTAGDDSEIKVFKYFYLMT